MYVLKLNAVLGDNKAKSKSSENRCKPYKILSAVPP